MCVEFRERGLNMCSLCMDVKGSFMLSLTKRDGTKGTLNNSGMSFNEIALVVIMMVCWNIPQNVLYYLQLLFPG